MTTEFPTLAHEMADWLRRIGFGFDFTSPENPLPEQMRLPLAVAYWRHEGSVESLDDYLAMLDEEGAW